MAFAWDHPPRVIGHRGAPAEAPENTLASFAAAVAAEAGGVELDARLTADGHVVVAHDSYCGRTVEGEGAIEEMRLDELLARDAGAWFDARFAGERVPLLADVLRALPGRVAVDVELKADGANAAALPAKVLDVVRAAGALDRVLVTSFDPDLALDYARLARRPAGVITAFEPEPEDLDAWDALPVVALVRDVARGPALEELLARGKTVLAWTVNEPGEAQRLLARGVAGVITDRPAALRALAPRP